jgi:LPS sulfotransferase NodH
MTGSYLIATTPRTGSFLLCEGLAATGLAGVPQEYAAPEDVASWRDFHGCTTHAEYFFRFPDLCRTPNGVFGAKLMWPQYVAWGRDARHYLRSNMSTPDIIRTLTGPPHVVRLVRRDVLRQAISWVRAQATGVWSRRRGAPVSAGRGLPEYDPVLLRQAVNRLEHQNRNWEAAFSLSDSPTLTVVYEDLTEAYVATVARVLDFLGLPWDAKLPEPSLSRQADDITEHWVERAQHDLVPGLCSERALSRPGSTSR